MKNDIYYVQSSVNNNWKKYLYNSLIYVSTNWKLSKIGQNKLDLLS